MCVTHWGLHTICIKLYTVCQEKQIISDILSTYRFTTILAGRLRDVYFITNKVISTGRPSLNNYCYYSSEALGDNFIVQCDNSFTPLTIEFIIAVGKNGDGVALREVEVYGNGNFCYMYIIKIMKSLHKP